MTSMQTGSGDASLGNSTAPTANRINVFLRIRPQNSRDGYDDGATNLLAIEPDRKAVTVDAGAGGGKATPYSFDHVWDGKDVDQADVFDQVARPVIENVFEGYWGTNLVYGQTGTGKSFSMSGPELEEKGAIVDPKLEGIIPRTLRYIFDRVKAESSGGSNRKFTISFGYLHIYLDKVEDLFNPDGPEIKVTRDSVKDGGGVAFPGLTEHVVTSMEEFQEKYEDGNQYRMIRATKINPVSSRGHAALLIRVHSEPESAGGEVRDGKLFLVDLAGYERLGKTGIEEGVMMQEARTINNSLLALGGCISALSAKADYIPWRNAKLTRILEDAIGGKAKCAMLLTCGPSSDHLHETVGTLQFGARAMTIKTNATAKAKVDYRILSVKLQAEVDEAKTTIAALQSRLERSIVTETGFAPSETEVISTLVDPQAPQTTTTPTSSSSSSSLIARLQKDLAAAQVEGEQARSKNRRLATEVSTMRLDAEMNNDIVDVQTSDGGPEVRPRVDLAAGSASQLPLLLTTDLKKEVQRRVELVKAMLEETVELKLAEVVEPLKEERDKYKTLYANLKAANNSDLDTTKDVLSASYEEEILALKKQSIEVQEKLKRNHATIKKSYQTRVESLTLENADVRAELAKVLHVAAAASSSSSTATPESQRPGAPSMAEVVLTKKLAETKVKALQSQVDQLIQEKQALDSALSRPTFFRPSISPVLGEYLPYLLTCHGDGVGRVYQLSGSSSSGEAFFFQLQRKLIAMTTTSPSLSANIPIVTDSDHVWCDASYLNFDGVTASENAETPRSPPPSVLVRGLVRLEEDRLYVVVTARPTTGATTDSSDLLLLQGCQDRISAIHREITAVSHQFTRSSTSSATRALCITHTEDTVLRGWEKKRSNMSTGIGAILGRFDVDRIVIQNQLKALRMQESGSCPSTRAASSSSVMARAPTSEIDEALNLLPQELKTQHF